MTPGAQGVYVMPGSPIRTLADFPQMPAALKSGAIQAAVLPEPFASDAELQDGAVLLADLDQGATTSFPIEGHVVTKQWAQKYPHTLAAFDRPWSRARRSPTNRSAV